MRNYSRPGGSPWVWVAILLGLSAVIGILVPMLSGGGLGSSAPPDWTPPPPTATPERSTSTPIVEVSGQLATPAAASAPTQPPSDTPTLVATAALVRATVTSTRVAAPLRPAATVVPPQATATPGLVAQVVATAEITATAAATAESAPGAGPAMAASPTAAASPTPAPTNTAVPAVAAPVAETATPEPPSPTQPPPTPTPLPPLSAPALVAPAANATASGEVEFSWAPAGELPPGTGYEVVLWNPGEDPAAARGVAPPTAGNSLRANLNVMSQAGLFSGSQFNWTVLVVRTDPYQRLTQPAAGPSHTLFYQGAPSDGDSGAPPPPKP